MKRRTLLTAAVATALGGCSLAPANVQPALYDFGVEPPPATRVRVPRLVLAETTASSWLQSPAIVYRLAYRDPARIQAYAQSRWAAPPAELVTQRLRAALGHAGAGGFSMAREGLSAEHALRMHLEAFEQIVDAPNASRGVARLRATLAGTDRRLRAQRLFEAEQACPSVNAAGGVQALKGAADMLIGEMLAWLAAETGKSKGG